MVAKPKIHPVLKYVRRRSEWFDPTTITLAARGDLVLAIDLALSATGWALFDRARGPQGLPLGFGSLSEPKANTKTVNWTRRAYDRAYALLNEPNRHLPAAFLETVLNGGVILVETPGARRIVPGRPPADISYHAMFCGYVLAFAWDRIRSSEDLMKEIQSAPASAIDLPVSTWQNTRTIGTVRDAVREHLKRRVSEHTCDACAMAYWYFGKMEGDRAILEKHLAAKRAARGRRKGRKS